MSKWTLVFRHEYVRRVRTRGFLFAVISMPLMLLLAAGLGIISVRMQTDYSPIGYYDQSGLVNSDNSTLSAQKPGLSRGVQIIPFFNSDSGRQALEEGRIQAFFIIPADYLNNGSLEMLAVRKPGENAQESMRIFLQSALLEGQTNASRIKSGSNFTIQSLDGSRKADMRDWFVVLFPFITGLIFIIIINISGGYLLQSVVDEKDNRTMEVLITSVSPEALMAGKILGNLAVGLTQLAIWLGFGLGGMAIFQLLSGYPLLPVIGGEHFLLIMGLILPGFIMVAALMTLVGVTATEMREAQQVSVLFTMPMVSPFWFAGAILQHPGNPLTTFLSIFPLTAIVTMPLRSSISAVPAWQMALAILLMWASALGALWLASRGFRQGMLVYGKRIRLRELLQLIRKGENHV